MKLRRLDHDILRTMTYKEVQDIYKWMKQFGLDPNTTREIQHTHKTTYMAIVYELDANGCRFFRPNTNEIAVRIVEFDSPEAPAWRGEEY